MTWTQPPEMRAARAAEQRAFHRLHVANPPRPAHPIVKRFFEVLAHSEHSMTSLAATGALSFRTVQQWRYGNWPGLRVMLAALKPLGYTLAIVPIDARQDEPERRQ